MYANPTQSMKKVCAEIDSAYVKLKEKELEIRPYSNGCFRLRMYFDRTCDFRTKVIMRIKDGDETEELHFNITLN